MKTNCTQLFSVSEIQERIQILGKEIAQDYQGKPLLLLCMLKGAVVFFADLVRAVPMAVSMDFMRMCSYGQSMVSSGTVQCLVEPSVPLHDYHVLLVEDILDTGYTMQAAIKQIMQQQPLSLKICTLLDKQERRVVPVTADYIGFSIPNLFVVGYGLDYAEQYRDLPYIGVLEQGI